MKLAVLLILGCLTQVGCSSVGTSTPSQARTPQAVQWDNETLQKIRSFLDPLIGAHQMHGSAGCDKIVIQRVNQSDSEPYYEILSIDIGGDNDYKGGTYLYSAPAKLDQKCSVVSDQKLHCSFSHGDSSGGVFSFSSVATEYLITKDGSGQLTGLSLRQNARPKIDLNCTN